MLTTNLKFNQSTDKKCQISQQKEICKINEIADESCNRHLRSESNFTEKKRMVLVSEFQFILNI